MNVEAALCEHDFELTGFDQLVDRVSEEQFLSGGVLVRFELCALVEGHCQ